MSWQEKPPRGVSPGQSMSGYAGSYAMKPTTSSRNGSPSYGGYSPNGNSYDGMTKSSSYRKASPSYGGHSPLAHSNSAPFGTMESATGRFGTMESATGRFGTMESATGFPTSYRNGSPTYGSHSPKSPTYDPMKAATGYPTAAGYRAGSPTYGGHAPKPSAYGTQSNPYTTQYVQSPTELPHDYSFQTRTGYCYEAAGYAYQAGGFSSGSPKDSLITGDGNPSSGWQCPSGGWQGYCAGGYVSQSYGANGIDGDTSGGQSEAPMTTTVSLSKGKGRSRNSVARASLLKLRPPQVETPDKPLQTQVELHPEVHPVFEHGENGTFILRVPAIVMKYQVACEPLPPQVLGMRPFKPFDQFTLTLKDFEEHLFDPAADHPPDGRANAEETRRGAVMEFPASCKVQARLKCNSPFGSLIIEDPSKKNSEQAARKDAVLNWRLQVSGELSQNKANAAKGLHHLEIEFKVRFECYMGGPPIAHG